MKKEFVFLSLFLVSVGSSAFGQLGLIPGANDPSKADLRTLTENGRLAHIEITPGDKSLSYYVLGQKEGEVKLKDFNLFRGRMSAGESAPPQEPTSDAQPQTHVTSSHSHLRKSKAVMPSIQLRPVSHSHHTLVASSKPKPKTVVADATRPTKERFNYHAEGVGELLLPFLIILFLVRLKDRRRYSSVA